MSFNLNMCILNKNISQITIPKTDFYLREELELFEYPSKCSLPSQHFRHHCHYCHCQFVVASSSSSSSTLRKSLWLLNGGGSSGRSLLSLGRAQELTEAPQSWFIPPLLYKFLNLHSPPLFCKFLCKNLVHFCDSTYNFYAWLEELSPVFHQ